jgi:hypothetical protein
MEYDNYIQRLKVISSNVVLEFKIGFFIIRNGHTWKMKYDLVLGIRVVQVTQTLRCQEMPLARKSNCNGLYFLRRAFNACSYRCLILCTRHTHSQIILLTNPPTAGELKCVKWCMDEG